jgi:hypothetical protein
MCVVWWPAQPASVTADQQLPVHDMVPDGVPDEEAKHILCTNQGSSANTRFKPCSRCRLVYTLTLHATSQPIAAHLYTHAALLLPLAPATACHPHPLIYQTPHLITGAAAPALNTPCCTGPAQHGYHSTSCHPPPPDPRPRPPQHPEGAASGRRQRLPGSCASTGTRKKGVGWGGVPSGLHPRPAHSPRTSHHSHPAPPQPSPAP